MVWEKGQTEVLHNLWEWTNDVLSQEELNNMFLAKDGDEKTDWNVASEKGQVEVLYKLCKWTNEVLTQGHASRYSLFYQ